MEDRISIIYESFTQLLKENKSLARFYKNSKTPGLLEAIWQARDGELETISHRLSETERSSFLNAELKKSYGELKPRFDNLTEENKHLKSELKKYKKLNTSLNNAIEIEKINQQEIEKENQALSSNQDRLNQTLIEVEIELQRKVLELKLLKQELDQIEDELKIETNKTKQYQRINRKMENELYRVTHELESSHNLLTN